MMTSERLQSSTEAVFAELALAGEAWGKAPTLCAVTKTIDAQTINQAHAFGIRVIGENRVQEAMQKFPALNPDFELHIIGQLQTNKVKYILDAVKMVQSLDRIELAREIDKRCQAMNKAMPVLIQVNIAREPQKAGVHEQELMGFVRACARMPGLSVQGLMAIMPFVSDPEQVRPYFRRMRAWFDRLAQENIENVSMNQLSMGMSGDYKVAAQEGATMVRVGSLIFGGR